MRLGRSALDHKVFAIHVPKLLQLVPENLEQGNAGLHFPTSLCSGKPDATPYETIAAPAQTAAMPKSRRSPA